MALRASCGGIEAPLPGVLDPPQWEGLCCNDDTEFPGHDRFDGNDPRADTSICQHINLVINWPKAVDGIGERLVACQQVIRVFDVLGHVASLFLAAAPS